MAKTSTLTADSFTALNGATRSGSALNATAVGTGPQWESTALHDLVDSQFDVTVTVQPTGGASVVRLVNGADYVDMYRSGAFGTYFRQFVGGVAVETQTDGADNRVRFRVASGQLYWESSANGSTWTIRRQVATPFVMSSVRVRLFGVDGAAGDIITFDNINSSAPVGGATTTGPHVRVAGSYVQSAEPLVRIAGSY